MRKTSTSRGNSALSSAGTVIGSRSKSKSKKKVTIRRKTGVRSAPSKKRSRSKTITKKQLKNISFVLAFINIFNLVKKMKKSKSPTSAFKNVKGMYKKILTNSVSKVNMRASSTRSLSRTPKSKNYDKMSNYYKAKAKYTQKKHIQKRRQSAATKIQAGRRGMQGRRIAAAKGLAPMRSIKSGRNISASWDWFNLSRNDDLTIELANSIIEKLRYEEYVECEGNCSIAPPNQSLKTGIDFKGGDGRLFRIRIEDKSMIIKVGKVPLGEINIVRNKELIKRKIIPDCHSVWKLDTSDYSSGQKELVYGIVQEYLPDGTIGKYENALHDNALLRLTKKLFEFQLITGCYHGDLHFNNVMVIKDPITGAINDFRIIDYGRSVRVPKLGAFKNFLIQHGILVDNDKIEFGKLFDVTRSQSYKKFINNMKQEVNFMGTIVPGGAPMRIPEGNHNYGVYHSVPNKYIMNNLEQLKRWGK